MRTVFNLADRLELSRRLDALILEATPRWGRMDCPRMLAHLSDGVRMARGELSVSARGPGALRLRPVRHALIYWLPWPKGAPTAPELIARRAADCQEERAELKREQIIGYGADPRLEASRASMRAVIEPARSGG